MANDTSTNNDTALDNALALVSGDNMLAEMPQTFIDLSELSPLERVEMQQSILDAENAVIFASLPIVKSSDILNIPITIRDARTGIIPEKDGDKTVINFLCENQETGELFVVTKGKNNFNMPYVTLFTANRGVKPCALVNYMFVEDAKYNRNGNDAIVLRKIQQQVKTVSKK